MSISNIVGEKIRLIREIKGFSQDYMAVNLDLSQSGYSKIESGKTSISIDRLEQIASLLEVDLQDLLNFNHSNNYYLQNNQLANAHQTVENFHITDIKPWEVLIGHLKKEIDFLRSQLDKKNS